MNLFFPTVMFQSSESGVRNNILDKMTYVQLLPWRVINSWFTHCDLPSLLRLLTWICGTTDWNWIQIMFEVGRKLGRVKKYNECLEISSNLKWRLFLRILTQHTWACPLVCHHYCYIYPFHKCIYSHIFFKKIL